MEFQLLNIISKWLIFFVSLGLIMVVDCKSGQKFKVIKKLEAVIPNPNDSLIKYPWFTCVTSDSKDYLLFLKVALESVFVFSTELFPVVIISVSKNIPIPIWLNKLEASKALIIIHHNLSFSSRIAEYYPERSNHGAYLRIDIPLVIDEVSRRRPHQINLNLDFGIYTDCDIIFDTCRMDPR